MTHGIALPKLRGFVYKPPGVRVHCARKLDWTELREAVRFGVLYAAKEAARTCPERLMRIRFELHLKTSRRGWRGIAYPSRGITKVFVGDRNLKPYLKTYGRFKDMPEFWIMNWQERLASLTAHECWHLFGPPQHGKKAEIDCELIASDCVDAWRKFHGYSFNHPTHENKTVTTPAPPLPLEPVLV